MQIILVSSRLAAARTIHLGWRHVLMVLGVFGFAVFSTSALFSWLSIRWRLPMVQELLVSVQQRESQQAELFVRNNLQVLAARLGELQAQMVRLDGLGQRLANTPAGQAGGRSPRPEAQGGPFVPAPLTESELHHEIDRLAIQIKDKSAELGSVESRLREDMVRRQFLPTTLPVAGGASLGSAFGPRVDPFGRGRALHEGLDFVAQSGTPVLAAAGGVVVNAAYHPEFGNLVEINHGGELITRYAHLASMNVTPGMAIRRGQQLGSVGTTGRSTGSHLHFEVRENGVALNPAAFLGTLVASK